MRFQGNSYLGPPRMKESQFVKENSRNWGPLEKSLRSLKKGKPGESVTNQNIGDSFVRITDDLSYAQTFYRKRSIRVYLNGLASDMYRIVFKYTDSQENPIYKFWLKDIPSILWHGRKAFLISFIVFLGACMIGAFSLSQNAEFANEILGNGYVNMTDRNIDNDDPMAVYKDADSWDMFTMIAVNNLYVMIFAFIMGLFFGIGTLGALVSNGVMLGVFQYYFYQKGLLWTSFLTIWQHGTVEISCIIIGGGAGLMLGSGYLFPGNYSRLLSLRLQFYRGMKVILAIIPFIIFAAFVEAYVTRHDDLNQMIRLGFITVNAAVILGYFVYLPYRRGQQLKRVEDRPDESVAVQTTVIDETETLNLGQIFQLTIQKMQSLFNRNYGPWVILFALVASVSAYVEGDWVLSNTAWFGQENLFMIYTLMEAARVAVYNSFATLGLSGWDDYILLTAIYLISVVVVQVTAAKGLTGASSGRAIRMGLVHFVLMTVSASGLYYGEWFIFMHLGFIAPIASMTLHLSLSTGQSYSKSLVKAFNYYFNFFLRTAGWMSILILSLLLSTILIQSSFVYILIYFINTFTAIDQVGDPAITASILYFLSFMVVMIIYVMAQIGFGLSANTYEEFTHAALLRKKVGNIPPRKKRYGIDESL